MAQSSPVNSLISLGIVVGVVWGIYEWLKVQCAAGSGSLLQGTPVCNDFTSLFTPTSVMSSSSTASAPSGSTAVSAPSSTQTPAAPVQTQPPPQTQVPPAPVTSQPACNVPAGFIVTGPGIAINPVTGGAMSVPGCTIGAGTLSPPATVSSTAIVTPQIASPLVVAAGFTDPTTQLNVDNWSYYYLSLTGTTLSPTVLQAAFPYLTATNRGSMTAQQFLSGLQGVGGLSGLGSDVGIPIHRFHVGAVLWPVHGGRQ